MQICVTGRIRRRVPGRDLWSKDTRRDNKALVEELLESSCFYFGTIIQEVENVRR